MKIAIFIADEDKIKPFIEYLDKLENDNKIIYGIHITHASVMSCYVLDRKTKHSHFVDGTEGGYTSAAKMLKRKLKNIFISVIRSKNNHTIVSC